MSTIVQLGVPAEEFALRETLPKVGDVEVQAERVVAHDRESVMPFCWATGEDLDAFEDAMADDPTVENERRLSELQDGRFYQMEWVDEVDVLIHSITEHGAAILKAHGEGNRWHLRILFPDRESFSQTHDYCQDRGLDVNIEQVHELSTSGDVSQYGLSEQQYDALTTALEEGYYEVPRDASARDLAEALGISHQAISERLRRGHQNLVSNALVMDKESEEE
ncbi:MULTISPECIES: bacterio-opsin activator domain-containing protein [Halorussus]|uniref:helix-turn-helix domain-containing protein n=1 Tax=Halorussus TaxID=1070314 RepID=UPI00209F132A|nr:helix-turn-helix domain-containing protein [Halorussus vallis]USZ77491.1 helix-turn-helix domain-containing protein [Halorussus vallis]